MPDAVPPTASRIASTTGPHAGTAYVDPIELPGYEILDLLGQGGMSIDVRARQVALNREVAVKLLSRDEITDEHRARFRREAEAVAQLVHPGIVPVYDLRTHPTRTSTSKVMRRLCEARMKLP